jgi:hypothetical protein
MKNRFKMSVMVGFVVVMAALVAAVSAPAQSFYSGSFFSGSDLQITAGSTNSYGSTNLIYSKYGSAWGVAYTTNSSTSYVTNSGAIRDVSLWADRDGSFPAAAVSIKLTGLNASATNVVVFNFAGVPTAAGGSVSTAAQNAWSFSATANGTTAVVVSTNLPSANFQGCAAIRLVSVASATGSYGTNVTINGVAINGYRP